MGFFHFYQLKKFAMLICIALTCVDAYADWADWKIIYRNGVPVSAELQGIYEEVYLFPLSFTYKPKKNSYVVRGKVLNRSVFLEFSNQEEPVLYSYEIEILENFGENCLPQTIVLVPDTCGGKYDEEYEINFDLDEMSRQAEGWYQEPGYFFFYKNKAGQYCCSKVICVNDNYIDTILLDEHDKIKDLLSGKMGYSMTVPEFENKLKKILKM